MKLEPQRGNELWDQLQDQFDNDFYKFMQCSNARRQLRTQPPWQQLWAQLVEELSELS